MKQPLFAIVKSPAEVRSLQSAFPGRPIVPMATNSPAYALCRSAFETCLLLDEKVLSGEYRRINRFAYDTTLRLTAETDDPATRRFLDTHFFDIRTLLIRTVKSLLVLESVRSGHSIRSLAVFRDTRSVLSVVASYWALENGIELLDLPAPAPTAAKASPALRPAELAKTLLAGCLAQIGNERVRRRFGKRLHGDGRPRILASGSLKHFAPLLDSWQNLCDVVFLENHFNFEKYDYCRKRNFGFRVAPARDRRHPFSEADFFVGKKVEFDGRDLSGLCRAVFRHFDKLGFLNREFDESLLGEELVRLHPDAVLLDEDLATRRAVFVAARECSIPVFVIPHGVPIVWTLDESESAPRTCESGTLAVNSEFEKFANERILYSDRNIRVTGTPRYDRIVRLKEQLSLRRSETGSARILYCGAIIQVYDLDGLSVLSSLMGQRNLARDFMENYLKDMVELLEDRTEACLTIKPHYAEEAEWSRMLADLASRRPHRVVSHREDILNLVASADLVITTPSSVICEAALLGKPVIVLDYEPNGMSAPYAAAGIVRTAHDRQELKKALGDFFDGNRLRQEQDAARRASGERFTGYRDGRNTQRVSELILSAVRK